MIAFAGMLTEAGRQAGMKVPHDPDGEDWIPDEYPHFDVFCKMQLGKPVRYHGEHWDNAKIVADIPEDRIREVTFNDLLALGFTY